MRVAVCASGGGSNLGALLDALRGSPLAQVAVVLSNRADAGALDRARAAGIDAQVFDDFADGAEWLRRLEAHRVELIVLAGYLKLVPAPVIERYRGRIINIHPALLPKFGGAGMYGRRVHQAVVAAGETHSGATVHLVDEVYDRGAILAQAIVPVRPDDDADRLAARVLRAEHQLLPAVVLRAAAAGHPVPLPEPLTFPV